MTRKDAYREGVRLLRDRLLDRLGSRLFSVMVFGSCATGGPFWGGSDLDVVVVARDGVACDAGFLSGVAEASRGVEGECGIPVSALTGGWHELRLIWSPAVMKGLADGAVCVAGTSIEPRLRHDMERFPPDEFIRGALRALLFERYGIRERFLRLAADPGSQTHGPDARWVWKSFVNAARFATWLFTPTSDPYVSELGAVFERFERLPGVASLASSPRTVFEAMCCDAANPPGFTASVLESCDDLAELCVAHFRSATGRDIVFTDPA